MQWFGIWLNVALFPPSPECPYHHMTPKNITHTHNLTTFTFLPDSVQQILPELALK